MEIGISTFVETTADEQGNVVSHDERIREIIEEIKLADQVGLDVYGVGEHHREDFAASSPEIILAAAAPLTKNIRLTSAVTVLSSVDPVRVFQNYATLDALSNGRAEIMAGRGSFTESFPLFGYDLKDYDALFDEHLELLMEIQKNNKEVHWRGGHRAAINGLGVYPNPVQEKLPITIGTGGNPESTVRAALLGLPIVYAIIGGNPASFGPLAKLYKETATKAGHDVSKLPIMSHSHGFVAKTMEEAAEKFYYPTQKVMNQLGRERGWASYTKASYDRALAPDGALFVGDPQTVANKIIALYKTVGVERFMMHLPLGSMPHADVMNAIKLLGEEVAPLVREEVAKLKQA